MFSNIISGDQIFLNIYIMQILQLMMLVLDIKYKTCKVFQIMNALIGHKLFIIVVLQKKKNWQKTHPSLNVKDEWG
jgi:hypothetical protein